MTNFKRTAAISLAESSLFGVLDNNARLELLEVFEWQMLTAGEVLFHQGDSGDAYYLLISGRLKIVGSAGENTENFLGELVSGDSFGELALISNQPRAATIIARRDSSLAKLSKAHFQQLLERYPQLALQLVKVVGGWLKPAERPADKVSTVIALLPLGQSSAAFDEFARRFSTALKQSAKTLHLQFNDLDQQLGQGFAQAFTDQPQNTQPQFAQWLSTQEHQYDYVILQAKPEQAVWTSYCCRHADKVIFLVRPEQPLPLSSPVKQGLLPDEVHQELVLLHSHAGTKPKPQLTQQWLACLPVAVHHHIRQELPSDYERLARHFRGGAVNLVLGGGGARGFAHIGVLKAMQELGIPIDRIGGASMGALIGAQYAAGYSIAEMIELNREVWVKNKPHRQFTLPLIALLSGNVAEQGCHRTFGHLEIEDLWLNFFCVSTNISGQKVDVHRSGQVWRAIMGTCAMPGICPPAVSEAGDILVDGGLLNNLPVSTMMSLHDGSVIAVDVSPAKGLQFQAGSDRPPSSWRALLEYFQPSKKGQRFPNLVELVYNATTLASSVNTKQSRQLADLCLTPPMAEHAITDIAAMDVLVEKGYRYALPKLADWWESKHNC